MRRMISVMSDKELRLALDAIVREQALRRKLDASPEKIDQVTRQYQAASGVKDGEPWEHPRSPLLRPMEGARRTHDGHLWRSTIDHNVFEPGVSGWKLEPEVDEDGKEIPPPFNRPSGQHDAYDAGDRITHNGQIWEAVRDGVVHSPDEYAPDWQLVEPEPEPDPEPPEDQDPVDPKPDDDQPAEWEQRYGHNPYNTGDRVLWQGSVYESVIDGNTWSPTDHPQGWTQVD